MALVAERRPSVPPPAPPTPLELLDGSDDIVGELLQVMGEDDELLQLGLQPVHPGLLCGQCRPRRLQHKRPRRVVRSRDRTRYVFKGVSMAGGSGPARMETVTKGRDSAPGPPPPDR